MAQALAASLVQKTLDGHNQPYCVLTAPETFRFGLNHEGVARFVDQVRLLSGARIPYYLDFTKVRAAGPAAALYLVAELDRYRLLRGIRRNTAILDFEEWDPNIREYFNQLGLYEILKVSNAPRGLEEMNQRRILRMRRHRGLQETRIPSLRRDFGRLVGQELPPHRTVVYGAIVEAMQNVVHHAYMSPDPRQQPRFDGMWWLSAAYDPVAGELQIVFLDQGAGIPVRLPATSAWAHFRQMVRLDGNQDAQRVRAALSYRRSSIGGAGRGHGFNDMMELVDECPGSWLRVLSGCGECVYHAGQSMNEIEVRQHPTGISGTIVQWSLRIGTILQEGAHA